MIYFTNPFTATDNDPWPNLSRVAGAALAEEVISNQGWSGATAAQRYYQSSMWPGTRDHRVGAYMKWKNAVTAGRWYGLGVRMQQSGDVCYWAKISSYASGPTLNSPRVTIYRRRTGTDTDMTGEIDVTAGLTGGDLNTGVTFRLQVVTNESDVVLTLAVDKGAGFVDLTSYADSSAARITSGGAPCIVTGANCVNDDVIIDDLYAEDFEQDAIDAGSDYSTGIGFIHNGAYYDESEIDELPIDQMVAVETYTLRTVGQITDISDFHLPFLSPGDDVAFLLDGAFIASGVVRPMSQQGVPPEGIQYEVFGPKQLSAGVVVNDPDTGQGQITFNVDEEEPNFDAEKANMTIGGILTWLFDNHTEGEDGLRAHKAAPGSGTVASIPAGMLSGPVIPGITVSGKFSEAVEFLLSYMPEYAWYCDPETKYHSFHARSSASKVDINHSDDWVSLKIETRPEMNKTAVLIRGSQPEITWHNVSLSGGTLTRAWDSSLEPTWDRYKGRVNRVEGTVANSGQYAADPTYGNRIWVEPNQAGGLFPMDAKEWVGAFVTINISGVGTKTYNVFDNTSSRLILAAINWPGSGTGTPTIGDTMVAFGSKQPQSDVVDQDDAAGDNTGEVSGNSNGNYDTFRTFGLTGFSGTLAEAECLRVTIKTPIPGGQDDQFDIQTVGAKVYNTGNGGRIELDEAALLPVGLVNYPPGKDGACDGSGLGAGYPGESGIGDIEAEVPEKSQIVPTIRFPTTGFRGTAYSYDSGKWDGVGEPAVGDAGVRDLLVVDDPNFQYQSVQEADYIAFATELLKVYGTISVKAEVSLSDTLDDQWLGLNKRVTLSDTLSPRDTGYEASDDLWVMEVLYDLSNKATQIRIGNMVSYGGIDLQAVRTRFAENARIRQFRDSVRKYQDMMNCMKEGFNSSQGAGMGTSQIICSSQVTAGGGSGGGSGCPCPTTCMSCQPNDPGPLKPPTGNCGLKCGYIGNSAAFESNASDAISRSPLIEYQDPPQCAPQGNESWIEDVVCCNQTHIAALWRSMKQVYDVSDSIFGLINDCWITKHDANILMLCNLINCINQWANLVLKPFLAYKVDDPSGSSAVGPDMECPCASWESCDTICECTGDILEVDCAV